MKKAKLQGPSSSSKTEYEPTRTGPDTLTRALRDNLYYAQGRLPEVASPHSARPSAASLPGTSPVGTGTSSSLCWIRF
jgi:hypothetical protein